MNLLLRIGQSRLYWASLLVIALTMEGIALYYQHVLNQYPCSLCIHTRVWLLGFIAVGIIGLVTSQNRLGLITAGLLNVTVAVGLLERSWRLLATERSWFIGSCRIDAGLPSWFALDEWFPQVFEVQDACRRTPELLFGVTMAEGLVVVSSVALTISALITISALVSLARK